MKRLGIGFLIILIITTLCAASAQAAQVSAEPSTPFLIHGSISYENGSECNYPVVNVTNIDSSNEWAAERNENSNYYQIILASDADVIAGETLQFDVTSPDENQWNITEHIVTQSEVDTGGFEHNITLAPSVLTSITVSPESITLDATGTQTFTASPLDQYGNQITVDITWSSSNTSVGTINASGFFTAVAEGTAQVNATNGSVVGTASVTVDPAPEIDLVVESITPNCGGYLFGNESNNISAVVKNNGSTNAGESHASFVLSDGYSEIVSVSSLNAGASTTVTITDPTIRNASDSVTITVTSDCNGEVAETNETNNVTTLDITMVNNGYKGKTYTGGSNMTILKTFDLNGNLIYSPGDSYYWGGYSGWLTPNYTANWTASDLPVPTSATIKEVRLYVPYCSDYQSDMPDNLSLKFNGNAQTLGQHYTDRKSYGSWDNPYGMLAYNVTDDFDTSENTANITNSNPKCGEQKTVSIRGMILLVIYEDSTEPRRQIFMGEEFDLLYGGSGKCTTPEEATAWAPITGATIDTDAVVSATLITFAPGADPNEGNLIFNGQVWNDVWSFAGDTQLGIDERDVTSYLESNDNLVGFQSSNDYMEASNAILIVCHEIEDTTPPASITNLDNTTYEQTYIKWTWTDPEDADFSHVMVYLDGEWEQNVTKGDQYYNATELDSDIEYEIATHTVDVSGNINETWKNNTASTKQILNTTPPASITNLDNTTYEQTYIKWTWTDPGDADFSHVMVYLDGLFKVNVTSGVECYNATSLTPGTTHEIGTKTVDTTGNINQTGVNHSATTAPTTDTTVPVVNTVTLDDTTPNTGDAIIVMVNATDNVEVTNVTADDVELTSQGGNIWNGNIIAIVGTHSVNVSAKDAAGNTGWNNSTSYISTTTTDTTDPVVNTVTLNTTTLKTGDAILVTVNATDNVEVTNVTADGVELTSQGENIWNGTLTAGTSPVTVIVTDEAGNLATDTSAAYTIDDAEPELILELITKRNNSTLYINSSEPLSNCTVDDIRCTNSSSKNWSKILEDNGMHNIIATDLAGNEALRNFTLEIDTIPQTIDNQTNYTTGKVTFDITTTHNVNDSNITICEYDENPVGSLNATTVSLLGINKFIQIEVDTDLDDSIKTVRISMNYSGADLSEIDEDSLKLYVWNDSIESWEELEPSGIDKVKTIVWGELNHLSLFSILGEEPEDVQDDDDNGGSSGGSSSSGGGASGELYKNIACSETDRQYVYANSDISYSFDLEYNIVQFVKFNSLNSAGQVATKVEILNDTSTLVDHAPSDIVYKNLNIWVGNTGWATERNIADATVVFTVEKSWITENNIDESSIALYRYSDDTWHELVTRKIAEDADSLHFESVTPGFSPFAITGKTTGETDGEGIIAGPTVTADKTPAPTPTDKTGMPGFGLFACLLVLLIAVQISREKK